MMPDHESWITFSLLFLALLSSPSCAQHSPCGDGSTSSLVFKPSKMVLNRDTPSVKLAVTCRHPEVTGLNPRNLALNRSADKGVASKPLTFAEATGIQDLSGLKGANAGGNFRTAINFTLPEATCLDAEQTYTCETTSAFSTSSTTRVSCLQAGRVVAESEPTDVRLSADPDDDVHTVGETLTVTCSATVGLRAEKERSTWMWEVKKKSGGWTTLTKNVYLSSLVTESECLKIRYTKFKINLRGSHDGTTYRCYLVKAEKSYKEAAASYVVKVDSFIFGLNTANGAVVLAGIFIIIVALGVAVFMIVRHYMRYHVNKERSMYRERVMNRLDKLFRFEAELIGGVMKKRKSKVSVQSPSPVTPLPEPTPTSTPTQPKKRLEEGDADMDPTHITIQLQAPRNVQKPPSDDQLTIESEESNVSLESDVDTELESDIYDPTGPMHKV